MMKEEDYKPNFKLCYSLRGHKDPITAIKFSNDGRWLASASGDKSIKLWNAYNGQHITTMMGHKGEVMDIDFSNDCYLLVSISSDCTIRLWGLPSAKHLRLMKPDSRKTFTRCVFDTRGDCVYVGTSYGEIYVFDVRTGTPISAFDRHRLPICGLGVDDNNNILSCGMEGKCLLWHPGTGSAVNNVSISGRGPMSTCAIFPHEDFFLISFLNSVIRLYDLKTGQNLQNYSGGHVCKQGSHNIRAVFCNTGKKKLIVSASEDSCIYLYDMETTKVVQKLEGHTDIVTNVICHPKEHIIASSGLDNTILLWKGDF